MIINHLALIWSGIIAFGIILYVILDGFDLGIGILMPFFSPHNDRDIMVSTILPVWDGNETWLVFGFPLAFSIILPLIYLPIFFMVLGLLFRGVAFEFRLKVPDEKKHLWDYCFFIGSLIATFSQGFILGIFIKGFGIYEGKIAINSVEWLDPFNFFCAIALVFGYVLLGSNRIISKTEGELQKKCFQISSKVQYLIFLACLIVSIWTPYLDKALAEKWFDPNQMRYLFFLPLLTFIFSVAHYYALRKKYEHIPFWCGVGIFVCCYIGFIFSSYPYIVPRHITYLQAAAPQSTLLFMLVGALIMLPVLLYYTYYAYKIFGGKVSNKLGY
jgi:cytochrome d ubiquinol oxidase subunit II